MRNTTWMPGSIVLLAALSSFGCDKAAAMKGPEAVPECADYLKVLDDCDAKTKQPAAGAEQKVFRDTWKVTVGSTPVSEIAQECKTNADEKRRSCGIK